MIGFQPYETFQLLTETGGIERANTLLVAACDAYARRAKPSHAETQQFEALVTRLFPTAASAARARAATILASAPALSPALETLVFDNLGSGMLAYLQSARAVSPDVMIRLIEKGDVTIMAAIAARPDLTDTVLARLFPVNSRKVYRALAANTAISPRGAYLNALIRSAEMDQDVASVLARRPDFDAALLTPVFFDLPEDGRINVLKAFTKRNLPRTPMMGTFEEISVATNEFTAALMKLYSENRRPKVTRLLQQVTGLDELRCGEIAHDTSGAALFVVLRAFGCTGYDGLKVLIHATSHDEDRSQTLAIFARLFEDLSVSAMVYVMSCWRGDVRPTELTKPEYAPFAAPSARTPEKSGQRGGSVGQRAIEALDSLKSIRRAG